MNFNTGDVNEKKEQPMQMICSGILRKDGNKIIYVRFERGKDFAEGSLPDAKITSHRGFSQDEIRKFEVYFSSALYERFYIGQDLNLSVLISKWG